MSNEGSTTARREAPGVGRRSVAAMNTAKSQATRIWAGWRPQQIGSARFHNTESLATPRSILAGDHKLLLRPLLYCHYCGARVKVDPVCRVVYHPDPRRAMRPAPSVSAHRRLRFLDAAVVLGGWSVGASGHSVVLQESEVFGVIDDDDDLERNIDLALSSISSSCLVARRDLTWEYRKPPWHPFLHHRRSVNLTPRYLLDLHSSVKCNTSMVCHAPPPPVLPEHAQRQTYAPVIETLPEVAWTLANSPATMLDPSKGETGRHSSPSVPFPLRHLVLYIQYTVGTAGTGPVDEDPACLGVLGFDLRPAVLIHRWFARDDDDDATDDKRRQQCTRTSVPGNKQSRHAHRVLFAQGSSLKMSMPLHTGMDTTLYAWLSFFQGLRVPDYDDRFVHTRAIQGLSPKELRNDVPVDAIHNHMAMTCVFSG
nr:hypothetical protein CFP56_70660 [Quercus suber]